MSLMGYYPEMGDTKPDAPIEASLSHYGKHWFLKSRVELKGRGVALLKVLGATDLVPQAQHKVGWFQYKVTERAFETIRKNHRVSTEILL